MSDKPIVSRLWMTPNPITCIVTAARRCRNSMDRMDTKIVEGKEVIGPLDSALLRSCLVRGEHAPFEHASITYEFNISRVAQLQLVRHRLASYSATSFRHCQPEDTDFYVPSSLQKGDPDLEKLYKACMKAQYGFYKELIRRGVDVEDARYILPAGFSSPIMMTTNFRELRYILGERLCTHAQEEIRSAFKVIYRDLENISPELVYRIEKCLPRCSAKCSEGCCSAD